MFKTNTCFSPSHQTTYRCSQMNIAVKILVCCLFSFSLVIPSFASELEYELDHPSETKPDKSENCAKYYISRSHLSSEFSQLQSTFQECWYAGGALGISYLAPEINSNGWTNNAAFTMGWSLFVGREFSEYWGLEYSFTDLGKAELRNSDPTTDGNIDAKLIYQASSIMIYHRLREEAATFNVYLKGGASIIRTKQTHDSVGYDQRPVLRPSLGAGILYRADNSPWFVRLDVHYTDKDSRFQSIQIGRYFGYKVTNTLSKQTNLRMTEKKAPKLDSDGDRVIDEFDKCPHSAPGVSVNAVGCCTEEQGCIQIY